MFGANEPISSIHQYDGKGYISNGMFRNQFAKNKIEDGYFLKFNYKKHQKERDIAYQWYLDEMEKEVPGVTKDEIGIALYDINGDGANEILVHVHNNTDTFRICPFTALQIANDGEKKYREVPGLQWITNIHPQIEILESSSFGWRNVRFCEDLSRCTTQKWNGKKYL
jgi:hypothetical protein